jgi:hypothetical protein
MIKAQRGKEGKEPNLTSIFLKDKGSGIKDKLGGEIFRG